MEFRWLFQLLILEAVLWIYHFCRILLNFIIHFFTFDVLLLFVDSRFQCIPHILLYHSFLSLCSHYYSYALELIAQNKLRLQFYEYSSLQCIEMAIWPLLYLKESWCESNISGQVYHITYIFQLQYISQNKTFLIKWLQFSLSFTYISKTTKFSLNWSILISIYCRISDYHQN